MRNGYLAILVLCAVTAGCQQTVLNCDGGFREIAWRTKIQDVQDDLLLTCHTEYKDRFSREDDEMTLGPIIEQDEQGKPVEQGRAIPLYKVRYAFCEGEFYEVSIYVDRKHRAELERIFAEHFGEGQRTPDGTYYWRKDDVVAKIVNAPLLWKKVEGRITYLPVTEDKPACVTTDRKVNIRPLPMPPTLACAK
ncbi:hypothetical protein LCGC14_0335490 [marine sediment metagenome]|uniref:Uncharacterized protein n=1 Tax=marine sediment metagenome TaxID=412755 RepID=A0A0F9TFC5_9ZZZZ|nr:hypothetical protein [Phycisphaerae bacterium]HDZ43755.1 hypothetical protein [Phycisphaerae bacterium]